MSEDTAPAPNDLDANTPRPRMRRSVFWGGLMLWGVAFVMLAAVLLREPPADEEDGPKPDAPVRIIAVDKPEVEKIVPPDWRPPLVDGWTLTDQDGNTVTPEDLRGKPYVAGFIFTRCATHCPDLVRKMYDLNESLKDVDVRLVNVTVDPEYDTVAQLKTYSEIYTEDADRWRFLTGTPEQILNLARFGSRPLMDELPDPDEAIGPAAAHSLRLIHVDAGGRLTGTYYYKDADGLIALRRVLQGKRDTPEDNRPLPPLSEMILPPADGAEVSMVEMPATWSVAETVAEDADPLARLPSWARRLPAVNASLNGLSTLLLLAALVAIKSNKARTHRNLMSAAIVTSGVFLACYLTYHWALHEYTEVPGKPFEGTGAARTAYYTILATHVPLAALVPVIAGLAVWRAMQGRWQAHKRIVRWGFPVWMYVSVTGVIIYGMLYHWPVAAA